jgi:outer membrane lipoprotein SlyB
MVGPVLGFTFGPQGGRGFVGAAGSPETQARLKNSYEVVVRFDDGRNALYEQEDVSDLRVGDKVRVIDNRAVPSASPG